MTPVETANCESIGEFLEKLREWTDTNDGFPLWYRGMADYNEPLRPSLYRHPNPADFLKLESQLQQWFLQRGLPFHTKSFSDSWDTIFYMQHYGFPTRLLDWSESPLVALYFAIRDSGAKLNDRTLVSVWVLSPVHWNRQALNNPDVAILDSSSAFINAYEPNKGTMLQPFPVALFGAHNSTRIAAQRGVFTIFGSKSTSMNILYEADESSFTANSLRRITFPTSKIEVLSRNLSGFGVTPSSVMQDLNHLAMEAKELYGF